MIINSGLKSKENILDSYLADSILLISRESKEKINGEFVTYNKTDAASVLKKRGTYQFLVQFITGSHKGEIYELRYNKSSHDDGVIFKYAINQEKLLTNSKKLPNELQASIQTVSDTNVFLTKDLTNYIKLINIKSIEDVISINTENQPQ